MKIRKERFGSVEGMEITLYTLVNDNGVEVSVMNYGATVTSVLLPVGNGNKRNIVCGFDTPSKAIFPMSFFLMHLISELQLAVIAPPFKMRPMMT